MEPALRDRMVGLIGDLRQMEIDHQLGRFPHNSPLPEPEWRRTVDEKIRAAKYALEALIILLPV